jgi:chromosome segregation ATPase
MDVDLQRGLKEMGHLSSLQIEINDLRKNCAVLDQKYETLRQRHADLKLKHDDQDQENEFLYNTMRDNEEEVKRQDGVIEAMEDEKQKADQMIERLELEYKHIVSQHEAALQFIKKKGLTGEFEKEYGHIGEVATQLNNLVL